MTATWRPSARLDAQLRDLSQRWRRCLASLLLFTIILTNNFGVSSSEAAASAPRAVPSAPASMTDVAAKPSLTQCLSASGGRCQSEQTYNASQECSWLQKIREHRLAYCYKINLWHSLNSTVRKLSSCLENSFRGHIDYLETLDRQVGIMYTNFENIIDRLDCGDRYSVIYNCSQCKEAYLDWLCSMYIPYHSEEGRLLRPCRSHCQRVQRVCPFFLPSERSPAGTQYAGEPAFFCDDPNIPDIVPFTTGSQYGDEGCCYDSCCLEPVQPECRPGDCRARAACPDRQPTPGVSWRHTWPPPDSHRLSVLQRHSPADKVRVRNQNERLTQ
ncbi:transmembrane protein FAM155B-like [Pollicipes pollicipes]|uniref:transmembrane protein FAM155B-like n=1 Tax=Pollicipes pollicipes TaxID=41117 RepID=UPI0018854104|nr:transmembrane protein FAM155B-like [Pollicipes pollicipes]